MVFVRGGERGKNGLWWGDEALLVMALLGL